MAVSYWRLSRLLDELNMSHVRRVGPAVGARADDEGR